MFVFPMMGLSSRFASFGYKLPKYMLPLNGTTVFHNVVNSFNKYIKDDKFLFICRDNQFEVEFIEKVLKELKIQFSEIIKLSMPTNGQADTVAIGLEMSQTPLEEELFIFNIDTFRPGFIKPSSLELGDGYLEVFQGEGDNWSFVLPGSNNQVLCTTEKQRISNYCSDGLYYFRQKLFFDEALSVAKQTKNLSHGEYYIAPLFNYLIEIRRDVKFGLIPINEIIFCGTPAEYEKLIKF